MKLISLIKGNKIQAIIALIVLILIAYVGFFRNSSNTIEIAQVVSGRLIEKVEVTGKVKALNRAELSFEKSGSVNQIYFKVGDEVKEGDVIASLDSSDISAQLQGAEASLLAEQAKMSELRNGLRPEEMSVEESKLNSAQTSHEDARVGLLNAFHDAYAKTNSAILNYADTLFINAQNAAPQLKVRSNQEKLILDSRVLMGAKLVSWKSDLDSMTLSTDPIQYTERIHKYLELGKVLLGALSSTVSGANSSNSGISQSEVDTLSLNLTTALSNFNSAVSSVATAEAEYRNSLSALSLAKDQFNLKKAGSSSEELQIQEAKVSQAEANVANIKAELNKKRLVSPMDGVIGKIDLDLGTFVNQGEIKSIIVSDQFKIEVNVPEADIAKIGAGNKAVVTLDAYDSNTLFNAHVVSIDLAETIVEGVPTYKVILQFDDKDARIRSGMTANIDILTQDKDNAILIPYRSIIDKNGEKFVTLLNNDGSKTEVKIEIGARGSDGRVEVINGLSVGSKVVIVTK